MMRRLAIITAAIGLICTLAMTENSQAQAPNAMVRQYGYQFCAILIILDGTKRDCMYSTYAQCRMAAAASGYCEENPAYIAARNNGGPDPRRASRRHTG